MTGTPQLAPFRLLREVARQEGIKEQVEARRDQVALTGWDIVPSARAAQAMQGSPATARHLGTRRDEAMRLFSQPDPDCMGFSRWLGRITEDLIITDAAPVWLRKTKDGERISSLHLLDGALTEPWPDQYGRAAGTRWYLTEIPRRSFADIAAAPAPGSALGGTYKPGQIQYLAMTARRETPFGYSPVERSLVRGDDGDIDLTATAEHLRDTLNDRWVAMCRDWLRTGLFAYVLEHFGDDLEWKWTAE